MGTSSCPIVDGVAVEESLTRSVYISQRQERQQAMPMSLTWLGTSLSSTEGFMAWHRTYGGSQVDVANSVIETVDGGFALAGTTWASETGDFGKPDAWLVKTDARGVMQWNRRYGGASYDWAFSVIETTDGGFALAGRTDSYGTGFTDALLVKTFPPVTMRPELFVLGITTLIGFMILASLIMRGIKR